LTMEKSNRPATGHGRPAIALIAGFGDSITAGVHLQEEEKFLSLLGERFGSATSNHGKPGQTTEQAMERLDDVLKLKPDVCTVAFGMNDHVMKEPNVPKVAFDTFQRNLTTICRSLQDIGSKPILCTIHPIIEGDADGYYYARHPQDWYAQQNGAQACIDRYNEGIREVAAACGVRLADVAETWKRRVASGANMFDLLFTRENCGRDDGVHPTAAGNLIYADCIAEQIERMLEQ